MKCCPTCKLTYEDGNLRFCLDDGTPLISDESAPTEASPTLVLPAAHDNAQTLQQVFRPDVMPVHEPRPASWQIPGDLPPF